MKRSRTLAIAVLFLFTTLLANAQLKPVTIVIPQPGAPVSIENYLAVYADRSQYQPNQGIFHDLEYVNTGDKRVVAVQIGILSFNVFNQFMGKNTGIAVKDLPLKSREKTGFIQPVLSAAGPSFLTGVVYVSAVRFPDGTIWRADEQKVLLEIRKIQSDFDAKFLKDKDPGR